MDTTYFETLAKSLLSDLKFGKVRTRRSALLRIRRALPETRQWSDSFTVAHIAEDEALEVVAREMGCADWAEFTAQGPKPVDPNRVIYIAVITHDHGFDHIARDSTHERTLATLAWCCEWIEDSRMDEGQLMEFRTLIAEGSFDEAIELFFLTAAERGGSVYLDVVDLNLDQGSEDDDTKAVREFLKKG